MTESTFAGCGPVGAFDFVPFHEAAPYGTNNRRDMSNDDIPALTNIALAQWLKWTLGSRSACVAKRAAGRFGKTVRTLNFWLSGGIPESAYPMVAREILAELDRQEAKARLIRRHLEKIASGETDDGVVATALPAPRASRRPD